MPWPSPGTSSPAGDAQVIFINLSSPKMGVVSTDKAQISKYLAPIGPRLLPSGKVIRYGNSISDSKPMVRKLR